ncbi:hypothetical protein SCHPADRAFT_893294 [Schizopora paradoxa]|uniref:Uncharacterized protein n=1 Tax=Schizopora paradoxa TaxID=27342 RepID=A0A0H2RWH0_9AGAM|nr:hypothetical protein SCHPADRAFT_893294 [Schizopora paradoxa]
MAENPALGNIPPQAIGPGAGFPMPASGMPGQLAASNYAGTIPPGAGAPGSPMAPVRSGAGTCYYFLAIFLPPLAVASATRSGTLFFINLALSTLGWLPGVFHACLKISGGIFIKTVPNLCRRLNRRASTIGSLPKIIFPNDKEFEIVITEKGLAID